MICHLCLKEHSIYFPIFSEYENIAVDQLIGKYFSEEVLDLNCKDEPINICSVCWNHIFTFHEFWMTIKNAQQTLKQQFVINNSDIAENYVAEEENIEVIDIQNESLHEPQIEFPAEAEEFDVAEEFNVITKSYPENVLSPVNVKQTTRKKHAICNTSNEISSKCMRLRSKRKETNTISNDSINKKKKLSKANAEFNTKDCLQRKAIHNLDKFISENTNLCCCLCSEPMENFGLLKKHFRIEHKCTGYVLCCDQSFRRRILLVDHLKVHNNPEYFKCSMCEKILASRSSYRNHMATSHPLERELQFTCTYCPRKFVNQYILDYHLKSHRKRDQTHDCQLCSKIYRTETDLKNHHKRVHLNQYRVICDICGKHFKNKQNFIQHMQTYHRSDPLPEAQCQECGKWLKNKRSLYQHQYKHRDEESGIEFKCGICGSVKPTKQSLSSHIRYHHSDKIFKCNLCDKDFKRVNALEEHLATHTGKALYSCQFCTRTFKSHANMHNHKKKMHPTEWTRKYTQPNNTLSKDNA